MLRKKNAKTMINQGIASQQPTYIITYFEFRARAEILKLICEEGNLNYRVNIISDYPNWPKLPIYELTPFGHLPVLQIEGDDSFILAQTNAISRFLCEQCGLLPSGLFDRAKVDSLVNEISDVRSQTYKMFLTGTDEEMKALVHLILPKKYANFERFLIENGKGEWVIGSEFTWADLALFDLIDESIHFGLFQFDGTNLLELEQHYARVLQRPAVEKYVSSERPDIPKYYEETD